jgi:imidazolonepropionase-like amidohydrolase
MTNLVALLLALAVLVSGNARTPPPGQSLALTHVTVIDMTGAPPKSDQTVVITDGRFVELGNSGEVTVPQNSQVIDASGKFLIPGLWDMHTHTVYDRSNDTEQTPFATLRCERHYRHS